MVSSNIARKIADEYGPHMRRTICIGNLENLYAVTEIMVTNGFLKSCTKHTQLWSNITSTLELINTPHIDMDNLCTQQPLQKQSKTEKEEEEEEENYIFFQKKLGWKPISRGL